MANTANYVKFYRGSKVAFEALGANKNSDTLYFITDANSNKSELYLGDKLISKNISSLNELENLVLENAKNKHILVYDENQSKWVNQSIYDVIGVMGPASDNAQGSAGLVPAPGEGQQDLFLRGDGVWASPKIESLNVDNASVEVNNGIISLKSFNKGYYAYVPASGGVPSSYLYTEGFKEGLEARVIKNNDSYVLAWYEPSTETVDDLSVLIKEIQNDLANTYSRDETYSKTEVEGLIAKVDHLKRVIVNSVDEIDPSAENAEQYIYMVLKSQGILDDTYDEYMVIEGKVEKVGSWEVDLDNYTTKTEFEEAVAELNSALNDKVDKVSGSRLMTDAEASKLAGIEAGAQKNLFDSVNSDEFNIASVDGTNNVLNIKSVPITKVTDLTDILNGKANKSAVDSAVEDISGIQSLLGPLDGSVKNVAERLNSLETNYTTLNDNYETILDAIQWHDMDSTT